MSLATDQEDFVEERRVDIETAILAMHMGFHGKCTHVFGNDNVIRNCHYSFATNDNLDYGTKCTAPTQGQLQRWLRKERGCDIVVDIKISDDNKKRYFVKIAYTSPVDGKIDFISNMFPNGKGEYKSYDTYEDALETGLLRGLIQI